VLFAGSLRVYRGDGRLGVEGGALVVGGLVPGDAGPYRCQVEAASGLRVAEVEVEVHTPARASILGVRGQAVTVREGASLALSCRGQGTPPPLVSWHRAGGPALAQGRHQVGLLLEALAGEDRGKLVCRADNGVGAPAEAELQLEVLHAPKVALLAPSLSPAGGCGLELQCVVHSSAAPLVSWYRDGSLLLPSGPGVAMWSLDSLHVLQLHACDLSLAAEYVCRAESRLGRGEAATAVTREQLERELARRTEEEEAVTSNNVRRNVQQHADAQPYVSSAESMSHSIFLISLFLALL
jgi:hypothetical protein